MSLKKLRRDRKRIKCNIQLRKITAPYHDREQQPATLSLHGENYGKALPQISQRIFYLRHKLVFSLAGEKPYREYYYCRERAP